MAGVQRPVQSIRRLRPVGWATMASGVWVPLSLEPKPSLPNYAAVLRQFTRISLTSREIFDETPAQQTIDNLLSAAPLRFTLAVLSRAALTLGNASYSDMRRLQPQLARVFLRSAELERIDAWRCSHPEDPDVYFLGEQQLLHAMTIALVKTKRLRCWNRERPPFGQVRRLLDNRGGGALGD
jgi:hypothetical protein